MSGPSGVSASYPNLNLSLAKITLAPVSEKTRDLAPVIEEGVASAIDDAALAVWNFFQKMSWGCYTPEGSGCGFEPVVLDDPELNFNMSLQNGISVFTASHSTGVQKIPYDLQKYKLQVKLMYDNPPPFQNLAALYPDGLPQLDEKGLPMVLNCEASLAAEYGYCSVGEMRSIPAGTTVFQRSSGMWVSKVIYTDYSDYVHPTDRYAYYQVDASTGELICGEEEVCDLSDEEVVTEELDNDDRVMGFYRVNKHGVYEDLLPGTENTSNPWPLPVQFAGNYIEGVYTFPEPELSCWNMLRLEDQNGVINGQRLLTEDFPQYDVMALGEEGMAAESLKLTNVKITISDQQGSASPVVVELPELSLLANSSDLSAYEIPAAFHDSQGVINIRVDIEAEAVKDSQGFIMPKFVYGGRIKLVLELAGDGENICAPKGYSDYDAGVPDAE